MEARGRRELPPPVLGQGYPGKLPKAGIEARS